MKNDIQDFGKTQYTEGQQITRNIKDDRVINICISAVGAEPKLVQASWIRTGGKTGVAYGGFQDAKDFNFQDAARLAISNAVSQAEA